MQDWIIQIINQYGYAGILLLIAVENIFPPIPSEIILTFGGFMTTYTDMKIWSIILFATIGSLLGSMILYGIGRLFSPEKLQRMLDSRLGKLLHFRKNDVSRAVGWFSRYGKLTVFYCRFIPIIRSLISIPAGISRMNIVNFLVLTTLGSSIWNLILVYLGALAGASWKKIIEYINIYSLITIFVFVVLTVIGIIFFYKKRFANKTKQINTK